MKIFLFGFIIGIIFTFLSAYIIVHYATHYLKKWYNHHRQLKAEILEYENEKKLGFLEGVILRFKTVLKIIKQSRDVKRRYKYYKRMKDERLNIK